MSYDTMDLKHKETGKVYMLTGHNHMLMARHGMVLETEHPYPEINQDTNGDYGRGFYNNFVVISIAKLNRDFDFVERVRPEGFVSSSTAHEEGQFKDTCKIFVEKYKDGINSNKMRRLDIGDGVSFGGDEGALFDLSGPATLVKLSDEVVKRLAIDEKLLNELINDDKLANELFDSIDEQMNELGCKYYTFERPDGGDIFSLLEGKRAAELRAVGLRRK